MSCLKALWRLAIELFYDCIEMIWGKMGNE